MPTIRQKTYQLLEHGFTGSLASRIVSTGIILLIVANVCAVIIESYAPIGVPYKDAFYTFNVISVVIFTLEYLARVWVSVEAPAQNQTAAQEQQSTNQQQPSATKARIKYMLSPVALIDLLAIIPFYLAFFVTIDLRHIRMLRMLRLLKLTHYFKGLQLFMRVLYQEISSISAAMFIMIILIIFSASMMYSVESAAQPEVFDSIPSAIWWSVVTMTTVGYGDVVPVTFAGKFIAIFIMLLGVGVVALPAAMLAAKFGEELRSRERQLEMEVLNALDDGMLREHERQSLIDLAEKLNLTDDVLEKLLLERQFQSEFANNHHASSPSTPVHSNAARSKPAPKQTSSCVNITCPHCQQHIALTAATSGSSNNTPRNY